MSSIQLTVIFLQCDYFGSVVEKIAKQYNLVEMAEC